MTHSLLLLCVQSIGDDDDDDDVDEAADVGGLCRL